MQRISVFDMLKIGVGPSSSHTMGPWRAALVFLQAIDNMDKLENITQVTVELFGSLAKTGKGHGTDIAVLMGLQGKDPATCETRNIHAHADQITEEKQIELLNKHTIRFDPKADILFHYAKSLPYHPNGIRLTAYCGAETFTRTYYSVGGGFIVQEGGLEADESTHDLPYHCDRAEDISRFCEQENFAIWQLVWQNEHTWRNSEQIQADLHRLWQTILECVYRGCHTEGELPGGLHVKRRAPKLYRALAQNQHHDDIHNWLQALKEREYTFKDVVKLVSCFALAVNEENAAFGRVVTAPTNGAAGVIPAVLLYYVVTHQATEEDIHHFLMVAGMIGSLFKKGATISAAQGGCQAEIGVSSAMAAGALAECLGASVEQALMAAEIAMEHHLGLTCDPIGGLVQIPCIERNTMGAMKAITAANIALDSSPADAKVSLDVVIKALWDTAQDMNDKYKETSEGGLATQIPVNVIEC